MQAQMRVSSRPGVVRGTSRRAAVVRAAKTATGPKIAIVGVTGAVGQEFLTVRRRGAAQSQSA